MRYQGRHQLNEQKINQRAMDKIAKEILMTGFDTIQQGFDGNGAEALPYVDFDTKALVDLILSSGSPYAEEAAQSIKDNKNLARQFGANLFLNYEPAIDISFSVKAGKLNMRNLQSAVADIIGYL